MRKKAVAVLLICLVVVLLGIVLIPALRRSVARPAYDLVWVWPKVRANPPDPLGRDFHFFMTQRVTISEVVSGREVKLRPVVTMFAQDQWRLPDYPPEYQILPNAIYLFVDDSGDVKAWSNVGYAPPKVAADPVSYSCPVSKLTENSLRIYLDSKLVGEYPSGEARRTYSLSPCYPDGKTNIHGWGGVSTENPANVVTGAHNPAFDSILDKRLSFIESQDNNLHIPSLKLKPFLVYTSPTGSAVYVMNSGADPRFVAGSRDDQVYFDTHSVVKFTSSSSGVKIEATGSIGWPLQIILDNTTVLKCARFENAYWSSTAITLTNTTTTTAPLTPPSRRCIIATAAYGSEMAPDVVYIRFVRDKLIGSTPTGKALVDAFNAFYYSWSPPIAEGIAGSRTLQATVRTIILPLVWIVHGAALSFGAVLALTGSADLSSVVAFLFAVSVFSLFYVISPVLVGAKLARGIRRRRRQPCDALE